MEKDIRQENKPNFSKRFSEWREKRRLKMVFGVERNHLEERCI